MKNLDRVREAIQRKPMSIPDLTEELDIHHSSLQKLVSRLVAERAIHVCGYKSSRNQGPICRVWAWGYATDVPYPIDRKLRPIRRPPVIVPKKDEVLGVQRYGFWGI